MWRTSQRKKGLVAVTLNEQKRSHLAFKKKWFLYRLYYYMQLQNTLPIGRYLSFRHTPTEGGRVGDHAPLSFFLDRWETGFPTKWESGNLRLGSAITYTLNKLSWSRCKSTLQNSLVVPCTQELQMVTTDGDDALIVGVMYKCIWLCGCHYTWLISK